MMELPMEFPWKFHGNTTHAHSFTQFHKAFPWNFHGNCSHVGCPLLVHFSSSPSVNTGCTFVSSWTSYRFYRFLKNSKSRSGLSVMGANRGTHLSTNFNLDLWRRKFAPGVVRSAPAIRSTAAVTAAQYATPSIRLSADSKVEAVASSIDFCWMLAISDFSMQRRGCKRPLLDKSADDIIRRGYEVRSHISSKHFC
jgi:hypothetical protein